MGVDSNVGGSDSGKGSSLSNPISSDVSITYKSKYPVDLDKYKKILRKVIAEIGGDMSPQESFEFRLQSRIDFRHVLHASNSPPARVEHGLAYDVTDSDLLSLDDEEVRAIVEDDDRYTVDWGQLKKNNGTGVVLFMPLKPLPHMPDETHRPSDSVVVDKAWRRYFKTKRARVDTMKDFYKHVGELCALMSPKESFAFRFSASFEGDQSVEPDDRPEKYSWGLQHRYTSPNCDDFDSAFKHFVEDDDRYKVKWGRVKLEELHHRYGATWVGHVDFIPKSPLPHMMDDYEDSDEDDDDDDDE
jgi:hypothetical protein